MLCEDADAGACDRAEQDEERAAEDGFRKQLEEDDDEREERKDEENEAAEGTDAAACDAAKLNDTVVLGECRGGEAAEDRAD